jgi:hypothetical protein
VLDVRCVVRTERADYPTGQLEALNLCGAEGWSVGAYVPTSPEVRPSRLVQWIAGLGHSGPYFILQRRIVAWGAATCSADPGTVPGEKRGRESFPP